MKTSKLCPKCQSAEIYTIPPGPVTDANPRVQTGWTFLSSTPVTRYLCGHCGYMEEWISSQYDLLNLVASLSGRMVPEVQESPEFQEVNPDKCPACGGDIAPTDGVCPSCGINFGLPRVSVNG